MERETVQADLDDASDASINPRDKAAVPGAPSLIDMFRFRRSGESGTDCKRVGTD